MCEAGAQGEPFWLHHQGMCSTVASLFDKRGHPPDWTTMDPDRPSRRWLTRLFFCSVIFAHLLVGGPRV